MTRYRVHVVEESVLKAVIDAPPEVDAMTNEERRAWLTEAALALADDVAEPEAFDCYYGNTDFWTAAPTATIEGENVACEKCWTDANREALLLGNLASVPEIYRRLLTERAAAPCTPDEQTGWTPY
jgi:hypothetical protein